MFTGLIEETGFVKAKTGSLEGTRFQIGASLVLEGVQLGDSIAVDGACMTVIAFDGDSFSFEASPESLRKTTLYALEPSHRVNLERPLTPTSRIGGHYVTGHVDGLAVLEDKQTDGNSTILTFALQNADDAALMVPKGSVAVLGISLTVNTVEGTRFTVAIIPHTLTHTSLGDYEPGAVVNIETDLLGKYARKLMQAHLPGVAQNPTASEIPHDNTQDLPFTLDVSSLAPAADTIRASQTGKMLSNSHIRTGAWFNFDEP